MSEFTKADAYELLTKNREMVTGLLARIAQLEAELAALRQGDLVEHVSMFWMQEEGVEAQADILSDALDGAEYWTPVLVERAVRLSPIYAVIGDYEDTTEIETFASEAEAREFIKEVTTGAAP